MWKDKNISLSFFWSNTKFHMCQKCHMNTMLIVHVRNSYVCFSTLKCTSARMKPFWWSGCLLRSWPVTSVCVNWTLHCTSLISLSVVLHVALMCLPCLKVLLMWNSLCHFACWQDASPCRLFCMLTRCFSLSFVLHDVLRFGSSCVYWVILQVFQSWMWDPQGSLKS